MKKKQKFQPKFLVGEDGKIVAVQLELKEYEALIEELEDAYDILRAEKVMAKKTKCYTLQEVQKAVSARNK